MRIRTAYDARERVQVSFDEDELITVQSAKDECDINMIIDRANRGLSVGASDRAMVFGDFTGVADYQTMLNKVIDAQASFDGLPAKVRDRFSNNVAELLSFVSDPANREEAIKLGLVEAPAIVEATPVPPTAGSPATGAGDGSPAPAPAG